MISEAKGPCFRVLRDGGCSLPILRNITKQICCCSRVGKAWGRGCQLCPPFGSGECLLPVFLEHFFFFFAFVLSVRLFATPWIVARQASLFVEFPRQEYWSGLPFPTPGAFPDPGIELGSLVSPSLVKWIFYHFGHLGSLPFFQFSSVHFSSVAQSCPTLCDPMDCSIPGLPVHHQLPKFTQTHVH